MPYLGGEGVGVTNHCACAHDLEGVVRRPQGVVGRVLACIAARGVVWSYRWTEVGWSGGRMSREGCWWLSGVHPQGGPSKGSHRGV
jgi:hypothetical protein